MLLNQILVISLHSISITPKGMYIKVGNTNYRPVTKDYATRISRWGQGTIKNHKRIMERVFKMDNFKIGDKVYTNDCCYGRIVEIKNNLAYVEFRTANGGGCLPFSFDELEHEKWCITTKDLVGKDIVYLG